MSLAAAHIPGAGRGIQKSRFWLTEPESHPLFRPQLAHLCDGGLQSKLCLLLVPGSTLSKGHSQVSETLPEDQETSCQRQ